MYHRECMYKAIREALSRLRSWATCSFQHGGDFYRRAQSYRGLFKAPAGLVSLGLPAEGRIAVDILRTEFMQFNGDFCDPGGIGKDTHPAPSLEYFYPYRTSWIAVGAHRLGRYAVSRRTSEFVFSLQDDRTGGFAANLGTQGSLFHICGTAQASVAACVLGAWQVARRAGDFLVRALASQTDQSRIYCVLDSRVRPVLSWPPEESGYASIELGKPGQHSYATGLASGALALLYRTFGEPKYLEASQGYYDFTVRSHPDALYNPACGKLAWASALLYAASGEERYSTNAHTAAAAMCRTVLGEPLLHVRDIYPEYSSQPAAFTYEVGFEYAYFLTEVLAP